MQVLGKITIEGVKFLKGITYKPIYDRIEAGTFMIAAAITNSKIKINGANEEHLRPVIEKLKEWELFLVIIRMILNSGWKRS